MTYDEGFVALARSPQATRTLDAASSVTSRRANPLCGDEIELDLALEGDTIRDIAERPTGCAIVKVSSMCLAREVKGTSAREARRLAREVEAAVATGGPMPDGLADLALVRLYPARRRCALLPWEALLEALT